MDKDLEKILVVCYPIIFREYGGDIRRTCMGWGMTCGPGWFKLIDELCNDITNLIGNKDIEVIALQVKEKFGGLRFYYTIQSPKLKRESKIRSFMFSKRLGKQYWKIVNFRKKIWRTTFEKISDRIDKAEIESYKICETCGDPGERCGGGWIKTLCDSCNKGK